MDRGCALIGFSGLPLECAVKMPTGSGQATGNRSRRSLNAIANNAAVDDVFALD